MKQLAFILISLIFYSCEKKELPIPKQLRVEVIDTTSHTVGPLQTAQVDMNFDYRNQIWFSLGDNKIVLSNLKTTWDICFDARANGSHLMLNGSRAMRIYKTTKTNLSEVTDTVGLGSNGNADMPSGNLDSTAIGNWAAHNNVYVIDRGYNENGQLIGYYKLKIVSVSASQYTFEYGDIYDVQTFHGIVKKDNEHNFIAFSFSSNSQLSDIEPNKNNFDLCFTSYTHLFLNPLQFYQVTGVLTNSYKTRVARLTDKAFDSIVLKDTARAFYQKRNVIGYDWKDFDLDKNLFTVNSKICYIINDSKGYYYKFHFLDFYNTSGIKGCPKFEFKRL